MGTPRGGEPEVDARVLTVHRLPDGRRHRSFVEALSELAETQWESWPVAGPRTLLWCLRHVADCDRHPLAHHTRFKQIAGVQHHDAGIAVHELSMRVLEYAVCYDQLAASELACLEIVARQAQLVELKYRDRVIAGTSGAGGCGTLDADDYLYLGTSRTRGQLMIDPRLEEFVAGELQKESGAAKERRKLREERGLQAPPPAEQGTKGGGKKK